VRRPATLLIAVTLVLGVAAIPAGGAGIVSNGRLAFIATAAGTTQVFTVNPDASGLTKVTDRPGGAGEYGLSWSPDASSMLVVLSTHRDLIYTMRPDGTGLRRLSPSCTGHCIGDDSPVFTRSGKRIAFERAYGPIKDENAAVVAIETMNADGTHMKQLTQKKLPTSTEDHAPTWSPDGRRIAFQRTNTIASPSGRSAIYVMNASGTHVRRVTPLPLDASNPRWSRDGTRILFNDVAESAPGKDANIYTVRVDGSDLTRLTHYTGGSAQAFVDDWSPDGTKIVFHFLDTSVDDLYVMDADGTNAHPLTRLGPDADPRRAVWGTAP
jgi:Tol biopolymer transport system component